MLRPLFWKDAAGKRRRFRRKLLLLDIEHVLMTLAPELLTGEREFTGRSLALIPTAR